MTQTINKKMSNIEKAKSPVTGGKATATAKLKNLRIAPRKVRLVADLIRGMHVNVALAQLQATPLRSSEPLEKLLRSAMSNAKNTALDPQKLVIKTIYVDKGIMLKRYLPRARGSATEIQKKFSHVTLVLEESDSIKQPEYIIREKVKKTKPEDKKEKTKSKPKEQEEKTSIKDIDTDHSQKPKEKKQGFLKKTFRRKAI